MEGFKDRERGGEAGELEMKTGDMVYERSTGQSFRVLGFSPEGKVIAIREKTIEGPESADIDEGSREFDRSELHLPSSVELLNEAELTPEHKRDVRDVEESRKAKEERGGKAV